MTRISVVILDETDFYFSVLDADTFKIMRRAKGLKIHGPCEIVHDYDDDNPFNPWYNTDTKAKRVWAITDSEIEFLDEVTYYTDRLSTVINISPKNIFYNAYQVKVGEQEKGVCVILKDNELTYCSGVKILGPSRWVYNPDRRIEHGDLSCGVWTETDSAVELSYNFTK